MNTLRFTIAATLALCATGTTFAATVDYAAGMSLPGGLPTLATGSPDLDGPGTLAGQWTTGGAPDTFTRARDITGYTTDPVKNQQTPVYGDWRITGNDHHKGGPENTMQEAYETLWQLDNKTAASAKVHWTSMAARATVVDGGGEVESNATWWRDFSLDPMASFTFTARSSFSVTGDSTPLATQSAFNLDSTGSFASLTMAGLSGALRNTIGAAITSALPADLGGLFSFGFGPDGLMSLTITNTTASALTGTLNAGSYVHVGGAVPGETVAVAAPVPEPEAILSMLAGLGLVGATVARRRKALSQQA